MPQSSPGARPLKDWLNPNAVTPPSTASSLLGRTRLLAEMTAALRQWRQEPWMEHLRIANLRGNVIVIFSSSAAALIPLSKQKKSVLDFLNTRYQLQCTELDAKVRPAPDI